MNSWLKTCMLAACLVQVCINATAQKKTITYEQAFGNNETNIFRSLPVFEKWLDEDNLVFRTETGTPNKLMSVNLRTKQFKAYKHSESTSGTDAFVIPPTRNSLFSPGKELVAYTQDHNLFVANVSTHEIFQLTFDGNDSILNGDASWLYEEEITGSKAFWWSADGKHLVFIRFDESNVPVSYVSQGVGGALIKQRFPKAGQKNPGVRIGIVNIGSKKITWADFNEADDQYFGDVAFSPSNTLWVQWINRAQDNLKIYEVNLANGSKREVYDERQPTWVSLGSGVRINFLKEEGSVILRTEKSGWSHFYLYDINNRNAVPITQGAYNVGHIVKTEEKENFFYFTARKENSARWDFYRIGFDGKDLQRITTGNYSYSDIYLSPGNNYFTATYSNTHTPSTFGVFDMSGKIVMTLGDVKGSAFNNYRLPSKKLTRVKSTDGLFDLPVTITYPLDFDSTKKYPVLMSVYGGPNAGKVYDAWSTTHAEIWWAQEGLVQVSVDNRSSGHFGKKGMDFIHRRTGIYEIEDFMAVGKWLKQQAWVNKSKLCITGFSFGGYMTSLALTYGSTVFDYGIAFWGTTSWELYDTHYTERYMDSPAENPEGYKMTNVVNYVDKYKGRLRIVHGTSDNNVHPQHSLNLISKLQDLDKPFEFMLYPGAGHGLRGIKWRHNKNEVARFYYQYLLNKKIPPYIFNSNLE